MQLELHENLTVAALTLSAISMGLVAWILINRNKEGTEEGENIPLDDDLWSVIGNHPQLRRPDRRDLTEVDAKAYARELKQFGYENVHIIKQVII